MADELTPQEKRELDAIDRAASGRPVDPEFEDIAALATELHANREAPDPTFARELDQKAAEWLAASQPGRRRPGWLRFALPAAAAGAAAVVIAVAVSGGGGGGGGEDPALEVAAVPEEAKSLVAPQAAPESERGTQEDHAVVGKELHLEATQVPAGATVRVKYEVLSTTTAQVQLGDRDTEVELAPGRGTLEISTEGLEAGEYPLSIVLDPGGSLHMTVTVASG